jgi:hypothetical protein
MAYRGYAMAVLTPMLGSAWGAALLSSLVFGFLHAYQGALGMVRTGLLGLILAASLIVSGSVWPAIIAHAGVDLIGGLVLGERMLGPLEDGAGGPGDVGVEGAPDWEEPTGEDGEEGERDEVNPEEE